MIAAMTNEVKDRHVLAAAVRGRADVLVTENIRDFLPLAAGPLDIAVTDQDGFLLDQLDVCPEAVHQALTRQVSRYRRQPRTVEDLLLALGRSGNGAPEFAKRCHAAWGQPGTRGPADDRW